MNADKTSNFEKKKEFIGHCQKGFSQINHGDLRIFFLSWKSAFICANFIRS